MNNKERLKLKKLLLNEENLINALAEIKALSQNKNESLTIKPTKIILPKYVIEYLASLGYDTQEKIDALFDDK